LCLAFQIALGRLVRVLLAADAQDIYGGEKRAVEVWLICVYIAVESRINPPSDYPKRLVEQRR